MTAQQKRQISLDRRVAPRERLGQVGIRSFTSLDHMTLLARKGHIIDASKTGFLLHVERGELVPQQFRDALSLSALEGDRVILMIDEMNLEIGGYVARTKRISKDLYEIAVDFSDHAPDYWRECLFEMLPRPGDLD